MEAGPLVSRFAPFYVFALLLSGCAGSDVFSTRTKVNASNWKAIATEDDRDRLRDWRGAFVQGLTEAETTNANEIVAMGSLLEPDLANYDPLPPIGAYQCRITKLGNTAPEPRPLFIVYPWGRCSIEDRGNGSWRFTMLEGAQRPIGTIFKFDLVRGVFLGTLVLSDETHKISYGRDQLRDMAGFVERVGDRRWRIILPRPHFESVTDVLEIAPL